MDSKRSLDLALRALADSNRRAILGVLLTEPQAVGAIAQRLQLSQQTTSHHLGTLRAAGLVAETHEGTRHVFAVNHDGFSVVQAYLSAFWPTRLNALKQAVEGASRRADG